MGFGRRSVGRWPTLAFAVVTVLLLLSAFPQGLGNSPRSIGGGAVIAAGPASPVVPAGCVPPPPALVAGSGSDFPNPLLQNWSSRFAGGPITYTANGVGTGISDLSQKLVQFAVTEAPLSTPQRLQVPQALQLPISVGGVAITYNLAGIPHLNLSGPVLAGIFGGWVTMWNDSAIKALNPGIALPNESIIMVHRSDASGATLALSQYLAAVSGTWSAEFHSGVVISWTTGTGQRGDPGVVSYVQSTAGTIGYASYAYALANGAATAAIQNSAGHEVLPSATTLQSAAMDGRDSLPTGGGNWSNVSLVNASGAADYPIVTYSYAVVYQDPGAAFGSGTNLSQTEQLVDFLTWAVKSAQLDGAALGFAALPPNATSSTMASLASMTYNGGTIPVCVPGLGSSTVTKSISAVVGSWSNLTSNFSSLPVPRYGEGFAFDPVLNASIMFGGYSDTFGLLNDTWELKNGAWTNLSLRHAPSVRDMLPTMVYDPAEAGVVLFGGSSIAAANDTWLYNSTGWHNLSLSRAPPASTSGALAWDPLLTGLLLLDPTTPAQTWLFSAGAWYNQSPVTEPANVSLTAMTFDVSDQGMLAFGGWNGTTSTWVNSTWMFSGNAWTQVHSPRAPLGRLNSQLEFDNATGTVVLFGGLSANPGYQVIYNDTWSFHAGTWTPIATPTMPPGLWLAASTYDSNDSQIVLIDGQDVSGRTISTVWAFHGGLLVLNASVSASAGPVPLPLWLNSTVSGGLPGEVPTWMVSDGFSAQSADAMTTLGTVGNFTVTANVSDPRVGSLMLTFYVVTSAGLYAVNFQESGLASGTTWSVVLNGTTIASLTSSLSFHLPDGAYSYSVPPVVGYRTGSPSGSVIVAGADQTVPVVFSPPAAPTYSVTFSETGLPTGADWSVTMNGSTQVGSTASLTFRAPNGSYAYSIGGLVGFQPTLASGTVTVAGHDQSVPVTFAPFAALYNITFVETGLPSGSTWAVELNGSGYVSSTSTLVIAQPNGSYAYTPEPVTGFPAPLGGTVTVAGAAQTVSVSYGGNSNGGPGGGTTGGRNPLLTATQIVGLFIGVVAVVAVVTIALTLRRRGLRGAGPMSIAMSMDLDPPGSPPELMVPPGDSETGEPGGTPANPPPTRER